MTQEQFDADVLRHWNALGKRAEGDAPRAQETEFTRYGVECPQCGEWHESDRSMAGKEVECACGCTFEVVA